MMRGIRLVQLTSVVAAAIVAVHCSSSNPNTPTPTPTPTQPAVTTVITGVSSSDGTQASQQSGTPPAANGGPAVTANASSTVIPNGSDLAQLSAAAPFQTVYVSVPNTSGIGAFDTQFAPRAAATGYYRLQLPAPTTNALILTNLAGVPTSSRFTIAYAVATASGQVGPTITSTKTVTGASGGVQVGVTWDTPTDVDLHVVEPNGNETYYGNPTSSTGGSLDLDSNAGCGIDNKDNENIRWTGSAPNGNYTVRVDYWSACNVTGTTTYAVVVNNGGSITRFTGTFSAGQADGGAAGAGRTITTFNHTTGISTEAIPRLMPEISFGSFPMTAYKLQMSRPR